MLNYLVCAHMCVGVGGGGSEINETKAQTKWLFGKKYLAILYKVNYVYLAFLFLFLLFLRPIYPSTFF